MRGEPINVENIGRTVTDGFEKVNEYVHSEQPRSALHKFGNGVVAVVGFLLKLCLGVVADMLRSFPAGRTHRLVCLADGRHGSHRQSACLLL